ncbi:NAD(P)/FAD-dependent oxidoreductase [Siccirubricoccus phaeus]|uniref:NAD(P)/FAD-dependent oxidoreductase n=1 Tax=Siccirubricoccus phaeus TaxID=2595053 RepID=UPI0011F15303|nr:NAD(P)/FAD-dependent oxidoreductase [Siccirubricoccus phaeus]
MAETHHVVVLGGGVAGIEVATRLAGRAVGERQLKVTLIDRETAHVWKPMLHTIAAGTRDVYQQQTAYVAQARSHGFVFQPGEVLGIDRGARHVLLAPWLSAQGQELLHARDIPYDTLVLALGSEANDFGTPGVREHCRTIDSRRQAIDFNDEIRLRILQSATEDKPLAIGIVGGGATGVELAAELIQLATLAEYYGARDMSRKLSVVLIESGDRLLAAFPDRIAQATRVRLEELGIAVKVGAKVMAVEPEGFRLSDGSLVEAGLKVWAAGVKAPDLLARLDGLEMTRAHQVVVGPTLRTTRDENIYALGDCSSLTLQGQARPLPPTAQVAHQQARYLARWMPDLLTARPVPNFTYRDFGSLVSLGGFDAYGSLGKFGFFKGGFIRGRVAQLGHAMLYRSHQARLHGFWHGSLLWLVDRINARIRPAIRVD